MKKLFFLVSAFLFVSIVSSVKAQDVWYGIKAGANFASVTGDDVEDVDGRTALHIGGVVNISITEWFNIQPELVYSGQGFKNDMAGEDLTARFDYINIPILADFEIAEGFSLQGGPQIGFNINSEFEFDGDTEDIEDAETLDLGVGIGAQYRLPMGLFFQARYVIGMSEIAEDVDAKNSVFGISAGWSFN